MPRPEFSCSASVRPLPERSQPEAGAHAFEYTIRITNSGDVPAQLIGRHWIITDATGRIEEVRGLGVVGKQPLLQPGESFEYTSWLRLPTPSGTMKGSYLCVTGEAAPFDAQVGEFALAIASALH